MEKQGIFIAKSYKLDEIAGYKSGQVVFSFPYEGDGQTGKLSFLLFSGESEKRSLRESVSYDPQTGKFMFQADDAKDLPQQPVSAKDLRKAFEGLGYKVFSMT